MGAVVFTNLQLGSVFFIVQCTRFGNHRTHIHRLQVPPRSQSFTLRIGCPHSSAWHRGKTGRTLCLRKSRRISSGMVWICGQFCPKEQIRRATGCFWSATQTHPKVSTIDFNPLSHYITILVHKMYVCTRCFNFVCKRLRTTQRLHCGAVILSVIDFL